MESIRLLVQFQNNQHKETLKPRVTSVIKLVSGTDRNLFADPITGKKM